MDRAKYLEIRNKTLAKKSEVHRDLCLQCFRARKACLCLHVKSFVTNIHFVFLIHPMEFKREKNATGRLSHLCLKNSQIITGIDFNQSESVQSLLKDANNFCTLLYPGHESKDISQGDFRSVEQKQKRWVVFILDATWPCAKKMMKLSTSLHDIPKISFSNGRKSIFTIKHQPNEMCLSTIESVHQLISDAQNVGIESEEIAKDHLIKVFQAMIDFQIKCASDPSIPSYKKIKRPYKPPSERTISKKWEHRKIIFDPADLQSQ